MTGRLNGQHRDSRRRRRNDAALSCAHALVESLESRRLFATFGIIGDLATTNQSALADVAAMVKSWNPIDIVTVGDNNNDDDTNFDATIGAYFHEYMSPYPGVHGAGSATGNHLWPAMGNHDWDSPQGSLPYTNFFTLPGNERYYNVRIDNVEFFMVDSDQREPDGTTDTSVQGQWLQGALAASTATWKIVLAHHPPYTSSSSADAEWMRWPFQQWGATAVVSGHHHLYERLDVGGTPYFINDAMGASLGGFGAVDPNSIVRYSALSGAMRMDAGTNTLTFRFYNRSGTLIDTLNILAPGMPLAPTNLAAAPYSSAQVNLAWTDNSNNETSFALERSLDGVNWSPIATPAANATSYIDADPALLPGVTYHYRLRAFNGPVDSTLSNTATAATLSPNTELWIGPGTTWKYLDTGTNLGITWRPAVFNDSAWPSGRAQLGYGDGDEGTVVGFGPDANNKYITTYFRRSFTVADPSQVKALDLRMLRDDGAVVYLNGLEVWRSNMPTGTISFGTLTSSNINGTIPENTWHGLTIGGAFLQPGNNTIAVEIHQTTAGSSDLSFDFSLTAHLANGLAAPSATRALAASATQVDVSWIDTVDGETGFKVERSTNGTSFSQVGLALAGTTTFADLTAAANTSYWYRVRAYDPSGDGQSGSVATATTPSSSAPSPSTVATQPKNKGQALKLQRQLLDSLA